MTIPILWQLAAAGGLLACALWLRFGRFAVPRYVFWLLTIPAVVLVATIPRPGEAPPNSPDKPSSAPVRGMTDFSELPRPAVKEGFVSSNACRDCHPRQFQTWHHSYHRTMTQPATPEAIVPDFDDVTLASRGRTYHLFRKGDEFWVDMIDPGAELKAFVEGVDLGRVENPPRVRCRVVMTTGSHHHQTYWVQETSGMFVQVPWVYHINTSRWVYRIDSFLRPESSQQTFNFWNLSCIACHATGGQPRRAAGTMHSVGELGISCEACHGPGKEHVTFHRADPSAETKSDGRIANPRKISAEASAQICGQCHSVQEKRDRDQWAKTGDPYRAGGDEFEKLRRIVRLGDAHYKTSEGPTESMFWDDGTVRTGGREYNGLIESACYLRGKGEKRMTCISCHSLHEYVDRNHQLAKGMEGNHACTQCHDQPEYTEQLSRHTHHEAGSSGSLCYNCHMPRTSYALFQAIRSHRVQSPNASITSETGRPNACNLCHLDQPLGWTSRHLAGWYGQQEPELDEDQQTISAAVLWLLKGDAAQRAVTAFNLRFPEALDTSGRDWEAPFLAELLTDPYPAVRYIASDTLEHLPGFLDFDYQFDGPGADREQRRNAAIAQWKTRGLSKSKAKAAILMRPPGRIDRTKVDELLKARDDRKIVILE